jgi:Tfp pilus assembly protein PilF
LTSIVQSGEDYAPAYNELGMLWFQKGNVGTALRFFEKAAQIDPAFQLNLARLYQRLGDNAKARASFEAFLAAVASRPEYRAIIPQVKEELAAMQ